MTSTPARRIAITGHRGLSLATSALVDQEICTALGVHAPALTGISCLADGADQIFARAVVALGGSLEVIIPAGGYRDALPADALAEYDSLLAAATTVHRSPYAESSPESHMAASTLMVDTADELYAIWDGQPARGYGGTADVVAYARQRDIPVHVIWPPGAQRD